MLVYIILKSGFWAQCCLKAFYIRHKLYFCNVIKTKCLWYESQQIHPFQMKILAWHSSVQHDIGNLSYAFFWMCIFLWHLCQYCQIRLYLYQSVNFYIFQINTMFNLIIWEYFWESRNLPFGISCVEQPSLPYVFSSLRLFSLNLKRPKLTILKNAVD